VTIHRLSPKNQVTVPREARALASWAIGAPGAEAKIQHLRGRRHVVRRPENGELFNIVLLMTDHELQKIELKITAKTDIGDDEKFAHVTRLNDAMKIMAIDAQNRVVLPGEHVAHLGLGDSRDVKFVCTNTMIQVWNPDDYQRYAGTDDAPSHDPILNKYLL
jgi:DNA-binding transcriptional regulator/RsmH inhibitor MraZ